ncbi:hypothetical protein EPR50_G00192830 [Perca flavescens]|uniref:TNFR-Cys domain-containing protein n=1 Tax=Perca flavescens TaxID=8167 RepID=A0A484C689_PERFV|nr:hypothetical protein EPR50_G00192830 [Perca flavescens]
MWTQQSGCFLRAACLLLVTFDPTAAKRCPTCDPGYFVIKNCSGNEGIQSSHQETLVNCSTFADSVCSNKSPPNVTVTTAQPAEPPAEVWITVTVTVSSLLLVLLVVSLAMLSRWKHQPKKPAGPDQV